MPYRGMDMYCFSASIIFSSFVLLGSGVRNTGDEVISFCKETK